MGNGPIGSSGCQVDISPGVCGVGLDEIRSSDYKIIT